MDGWKDGEMYAGLHASVDGLYGKINRQIDKSTYMHYIYVYTHICTYTPPYKYT
jgi:hypothetical protein